MSTVAPPSRMCPGCLVAFTVGRIESNGGVIPEHRMTRPDDTPGERCRGSARPPREPGYGRGQHVIV